MQELFAVLPPLLKNYGDISEVRESVAFAAWRVAAGEQLSGHTEPIAFDGDRLIVAVADRSWQRNLEELAREMIFRINSKIGSKLIGFIEFRIDKERFGGDRSNKDRAEFELAALNEITEPLLRAADAIQDNEMRRKFLLAAGSCLARERRMTANE
jgi:hypothetical protein